MWPFARPRPEVPAATPASVSIDAPLPILPLWSQFSRIGGNLTPLRVTEIIQQADSGYPARLVGLFHESRQKDCHLQSVMAAAEEDITSLEWMVAPPKNATPLEERCAAEFAEVWEEADKEAGISHLVGESIAFGYAFAEVAWKLEGGRFIPVKLKPVSCERFGFRQSDGALLFDPKAAGSVDRDGVDLEIAYPGKFVAIRRRINGDVPVREGLARCLIWAALGRNWSYKDWLTLGEIGFKPSVIGVYQKDASTRDINHLSDVIERYHSTGKATISEKTSLHVEWPKHTASGGGGGLHKELQDHLASEMSKAVLHGTLTVDAGTKGARSLGEVHDKGRNNVRDTNARVLVTALTSGPSAAFAAVNYGPMVRAPRVVLATEDQIDLVQFGRSLKELRAAGLRRIPAAWVRDQAGIPEAGEGEETLDIEVTPEGFGTEKTDDGEDDSEE
jgi:phage gp29-like protein